MWICPERVTTKKLPLQKLYKAAAEYIQENNIEVDICICQLKIRSKDHLILGHFHVNKCASENCTKAQ